MSDSARCIGQGRLQAAKGFVPQLAPSWSTSKSGVAVASLGSRLWQDAIAATPSSVFRSIALSKRCWYCAAGKTPMRMSRCSASGDAPPEAAEVSTTPKCGVLETCWTGRLSGTSWQAAAEPRWEAAARRHAAGCTAL